MHKELTQQVPPIAAYDSKKCLLQLIARHLITAPILSGYLLWMCSKFFAFMSILTN